jgi:hypothetical protein
MFVTKQEILDAIKSENLIGGHGPISGIYNPQTGAYYYDDACPVCAVGAVLRQTGVESNNISYAFHMVVKNEDADVNASVEYALSKRNWMAAMSIKFEQLYYKEADKTVVRKKLATFVKKNLPSRVKLNGIDL